MSSKLNVLLIEDNEEHAKIISRYLLRSELSDVQLSREENLRSGLHRLIADRFDVLLLDLRLPDSDIQNTLPVTVKTSPSIPIVVLSSLEDRQLAINAVHEGAQDYLCKTGLSSELLIRAIYSAMERKQTELQLRREASQKLALFELSQEALKERSLLTLCQKAIELVAKTLNADKVCIMEFAAHERAYIMKSGLGWSDTEEVPRSYLGTNSLFEHPIDNTGPLILPRLSVDTRFRLEPFIASSGAASAIVAPIHGFLSGERQGSLACFTKEPRLFSRDDGSFLQAVANTLVISFYRFGLEEELKKKVQELDTAHRRKDEFLATLSHELRTPLNVITGYTEVLKSADPSSEEFAQAIAAIERNTKHETQLVSDTLDLSQIITGKMRLDVKQFVFEDVVQSSIESIQFSAHAKQIRIQFPALQSRTLISGDENKVHQMIWNLLANAVKFTPSGGTITVEVHHHAQKAIDLTVSDTGIGIAPESIGNVFERFWQEDPGINRKYMGLGLGLSIVRHIAELHGGTVSVTSAGIGKGSTFKVMLPLIGAVLSPTIAKHPFSHERRLTDKVSLVDGALLDKHILIVDDSIDSLMMLAMVLRKSGAFVTSCSSATRALEEFKTGHFDIVISDIGMPEIDGYEFMRRVREWEKELGRPETPSIALTAHVGESDIAQALNAGFQIHLPKPLNTKDLAHSVTQLTRQSRSEFDSKTFPT